MQAPGDCAGVRALVSYQGTDFEFAVEAGGRPLDGFSLARIAGKAV
jgi:hypothetical protein